MVTKIGLDLGYANITISDVSSGIFREPSVALIDRESRRIASVGNAALSEENTNGMVLVRPFKNGLLFDHQLTQGIINTAVKAVLPAERLRCVVGVPSDFLPKQEKELFAMLNAAGVSDCFSVNRALAALVGAGYSPAMSVISVNIGAASTEIAVFSDGVITHTVREAVGGEDFDKAVKQYIYEQGDVNVSLSVARAIKEKLGSVWSGKENDSVDIEGTLSLTGNRVKMNITTEDIIGVFEKPLHKLFMAVAGAIKKIPIDNVEKTFKNGIVLTGGASLIHGLDIMMSKVLGVSVTRPDDALDSVAKGLSRINTFIPVKGRAANKNVTNSVAKYYENKKST
ncbi:MAG: rod shape-determining protein [Clostridia bacterium]|nr:rod shape-determining protein [Clostridia bacterium]MBO5206057.1 rod shape-determining protein [Clostridia bacterium]MBQ8583235.1 rod shape-determining protein [Clostridia bacterium]